MKRMIVLMLAVMTLAAGCGGGAAEPEALQPVEFTLTATDIVYDDTQLEVAAGQPVRVVLDNQGALVHDFSIVEIPHSGEVTVVATTTAETAGHEAGMDHADEPDVHVAVAPGGTGSVTFTPAAAGTYEYYCTVAGHKEAGMVGTLVVTGSE